MHVSADCAIKYPFKNNCLRIKVCNFNDSRAITSLCDSKARKLKGFGEFPQRLIKEYDEDIDELMATASKIEY